MNNIRSLIGAVICALLALFSARTTAQAQGRPQVAQQATADFARLGSLQIQVVGSPRGSRVVFRSRATGKVVAPLTRGGRAARRDELAAATGDALFFKVFDAGGAAGPIILVSTVHRGADYCGYTVRVLGEVAGRLRLLTARPFEADDMGGLHFGDLGGANGRGVAVWDFVWGKEESHFDAHRYEFKLFKYMAGSGGFSKATVIRSKLRHASWEEAAEELRLPYRNALTACEELFGDEGARARRVGPLTNDRAARSSKVEQR